MFIIVNLKSTNYILIMANYPGTKNVLVNASDDVIAEPAFSYHRIRIDVLAIKIKQHCQTNIPRLFSFRKSNDR